VGPRFKSARHADRCGVGIAESAYRPCVRTCSPVVGRLPDGSTRKSFLVPAIGMTAFGRSARAVTDVLHHRGFECLGIPDLDIALAVINVLAGIALGLRYRVVILVPAVSLVVTFAVIVGIARGDHLWSIILAMVIVGTAIQLGYLIGIAIRAAIG